MKLTDRPQRIARITRDVRLRAYPPPADPREPLVIGRYNPPSPVIVMRADFVALAEELAETAALRAEVARLKTALAPPRSTEEIQADFLKARREAHQQYAEEQDVVPKCDGTCPGNELGDCYGAEWHRQHATPQPVGRHDLEHHFTHVEGCPQCKIVDATDLQKWIQVFGEHCIRAGRSLTAAGIHTDSDLAKRVATIFDSMPTLTALVRKIV